MISKKYTYGTETLIDEHTYTYGNSNWQDQLTKYDNESITYDAIGNPLTMGDKTFTWRNGRELASYSDTNNNASYIYNNDGIRTSKTVNNVTTNYYLKGNKIVFEEKNNTVLYYIYNNDELVGFKYNGNIYHYHKNLFGDVIGIYDSNNNEIVTYEYDSWGAIVNTIDNSNINLSTINPFRYRSYYYDEETKLYYLNSRYYNPAVGRFVNADAYVSTGQGTIGHNMYNYCGNNPVTRSDDGYKWLEKLNEIISKRNQAVKNLFRATFGSSKSVTNAVDKTIIHNAFPDWFPISYKVGTYFADETYKSGDDSRPITFFSDVDTTNLSSTYSSGIKFNGLIGYTKINLGKENAGYSMSMDIGNKNVVSSTKINIVEMKYITETLITSPTGDGESITTYYTMETDIKFMLNAGLVLATIGLGYGLIGFGALCNA